MSGLVQHGEASFVREFLPVADCTMSFRPAYLQTRIRETNTWGLEEELKKREEEFQGLKLRLEVRPGLFSGFSLDLGDSSLDSRHLALCYISSGLRSTTKR
jgi:hypothetical protein